MIEATELASKENAWLIPPPFRNLRLPQGFHQSIFKGYMREGVTGSVISSCTILWLVGIEITGLTLSILRRQQVWRLRALDHQVANFFHLVVVLASVKQLRKYASDTVIWVLQRGNYSRRCGEGSVQGRPQRVLLGYTPASQAAFLTCQNSQIWSTHLPSSQITPSLAK